MANEPWNPKSPLMKAQAKQFDTPRAIAGSVKKVYDVASKYNIATPARMLGEKVGGALGRARQKQKTGIAKMFGKKEGSVQSPAVGGRQPWSAKPKGYTPFVGGQQSKIPAGDSYLDNKRKVSYSGADGSRGMIEVLDHGYGKRPPNGVGGKPRYQVSAKGMTWSPEEFNRFARQPTAPGTRMVRAGRPEGGWSPDYGRNQDESQVPRFDAPGFTGKAKAARIHSQEQQWLKRQDDYSQQSSMEGMKQSGETGRTGMRQAGATGRASLAAGTAQQRLASDEISRNIEERGRSAQERRLQQGADLAAKKYTSDEERSKQPKIMTEQEQIASELKLRDYYDRHILTLKKGVEVLPYDKWLKGRSPTAYKRAYPDAGKEGFSLDNKKYNK